MIRFEKVTPNNWRQGLKVSEVQKMYVANDMQILARAYAFRDMRSNALFIYNITEKGLLEWYFIMIVMN